MNRLAIVVLLSVLGYLNALTSSAQQELVRIKRNQVLVIQDSLYVPGKDTSIYLPKGTEYHLYDNRYILSQNFYDSVYSKAQKSRITEELYNLLINHKPPEAVDTKDPVKSESFFEGYRGKQIASIDFIVVDIIEGSIYDTTITARSRIGKISNNLHQDTKNEVLQKHLLFKEGDTVDPYQVADSERILRTLSYIEDARIIFKIDPNDLDKVYATVIVKDRFPWSGRVEVNEDDAAILGFTNRNIMGTGNEFSVGYYYSPNQEPKHGVGASYTVRNIEDSFVDATVFASDNYEGSTRGVTFKRDFVSPEIKYYGEATVQQLQPIQDLIFIDSVYAEDFQSSYNNLDFWGARAFRIGKRRNINLAARIIHDEFQKRPTIARDSNELYYNHEFLLGAISYSKINFLKTKNVFSFNITEDIPIGYNFSYVLGTEWTEFGSRIYRGFRANVSDYNFLGYLFLEIESGAYHRAGLTINDILQINIRHFTPLHDMGNGRFTRIFTRLHYFKGENLSIPYANSLVGENRIKNIEGRQIQGDRIFTLSTEYVMFQPWYFYGFRFATYGFMSVGHVRESRLFPFRNTFYNFGGGIRIRNEGLVFDTFEFRISLFPNAPEDSNIFYFKFSISPTNFFSSPNVAKPRVVGIN